MRTESLKKNSSKDRTRKRKPKTTKRRRDSSSSSSYSSGSDGRARKKAKKSSSERRRQLESKKHDRERARRTRRRRDATISSTSGDATDSDSSRLRSPARLARSRVGGLSRERSRLRRSCSTCSGYITCSDSSRSRSRSASEGRSRRSRDRSRGRKKVRDGRGRDKRSRDEGEVKIIKAYDDFPSSRSNRGYSGERKRVGRLEELAGRHLESEKKWLPEVIEDMAEDDSVKAGVKDGIYEKGREVVSSKKSSWPAEGGGEGGSDGRPLDRQTGLTKEGAAGNKSESVANTGDSEGDGLEMILRQKALENFRKHSMKKVSDGFDKEESFPTESSKDARKAVEVKPSSQVVKSSVTLSKSKPMVSLEHYKSEDKERSVAKPVPRLSSLVIPCEKNDRDLPLDSANDVESSKTLIGSVSSGSVEAQNNRRQIVKVHEAPMMMSSEKTSLVKDTEDKRRNLRIHESSNKKPSEQASLVKDMQDKRASTVLRTSKPVRTEISKALGASSSNKMILEHASLVKDPGEKKASTELGSSKTLTEDTKVVVSALGSSSFQNSHTSPCNPTEPTAGSQFEQKTFSRMHDGEMVQVSYKVYIPKRRPTLSRRQLQR